jgi:hypothetical protein
MAVKTKPVRLLQADDLVLAKLAAARPRPCELKRCWL